MSSLAFIPLILFISVAFMCGVVRVIVALRERPRPRLRRARPNLVVIQGGGAGKVNAPPASEPVPESRIA